MHSLLLGGVHVEGGDTRRADWGVGRGQVGGYPTERVERGMGGAIGPGSCGNAKRGAGVERAVWVQRV